MKNVFRAILAVFLTVLSFGLNGQCSGGSNGGSFSSMSSTYQTISVTSYNYYTFSASSGENYKFSFCEGGGSASFDTQITILYDSDGSYAGGYNDDNCSTQSEVSWTAPSTETFRVLISEYGASGCGTSTAYSGTLAYKLLVSEFDGSTSTKWDVASNWSTGSVPTSSDNVLIPSGQTVDIDLDAAAACLNLTIASGGTLNVDIDSDWLGEMTISGDLTINGTLNHTGPTMIYLDGTSNSITTGGSASVSELGFLFDTGSDYTISGDLSIEYLRQISSSATLRIDDGTILTTCYFVQEGYLYMNSGDLEIGCGTSYGVSPDGTNPYFSESYLSTGTGTIYYNSGEVYSAVNQTVKSIDYYDLKVRTNNGYTVTIGNGSEVVVDNDFELDNPGTGGGVATTNDAVYVENNVILGNTGNAFTLNVADPIRSNNGTFTMGNNSSSAINITYAALDEVEAISGFSSEPAFYGTVTYNSSSNQRVISATSYNNLTLNGTGTKLLVDNVDINGTLTLTNGTFESGDGSSNIETYFGTHSTSSSIPTVVGGVATGNNTPTLASLQANATSLEVFVPSSYSGYSLEGIRFDLDHTYNGDVDIYLVDPDNNVHVVATDNGGNKDDYPNTELRDGYSALPTGDTVIGAGPYAADNFSFDGYSGTINGTWILYVIDDSSGDTGTLYDFLVILKKTSSNYNDLNVAGDWVMGSGTFNYGQSNVTFDGSATQNVNAALADLDFYDLTIDGTDVKLNTNDFYGTNVYNDLLVNSGKSLMNYCTDDDVDDFGFSVDGHITNNGTIDDSNDAFYISMDGTSKNISGSGTFTSFWLQVRGTISVTSSIDITQILVDATYSATVNSGLTFGLEKDVINDGAFTISGSSIVEIGDDFDNGSGVFNENTSTVIFNNTSGSGVQSITTGGYDFYKVTFDSDASITLVDDMEIDNVCTFTDGIINPTTSEKIIITETGSVTGASDASHCSGAVAKMCNSTSLFTFPVGNGTVYRPSGVIPTSSTATTFQSQYYDSQTYTYDQVDQGAGTIDHASDLEYWDVSRTSGTANATVELSWDANSGVADLADLIVAHWDAALNGGSGAWEAAGNTQTTGDATSGTIRSTSGLSEFSPHALGSTTPDNPLPIELMYLEANCVDQGVEVKWATASEENNELMVVEKSTDGFNFEGVETVYGAGTSNEMNMYSVIDENITGNMIYRIAQYDVDGEVTYTSVVGSNCVIAKEGIINVSSNNGGNIINVLTNIEGPFVSYVYDMNGRLIDYVNVSLDGQGTFQIDLSTAEAGIYQLQIVAENGRYTERLIKR